MTTRLACRFCIATRGLKGSEIKHLSRNDDEFADHVEREHHIPVRREGESMAQCEERFAVEQPEAGGPNCKCPACERDRKCEADLHELLRQHAEMQ